MRLHALFLFTGIIRLVLGIEPMVPPLQTSSFTNLSFVDFPDPLTGHSILLHTLRAFVGKRGLTIMRISRYFRPTSTIRCLWISVTLCPSIRFTCFHLHKVPEGRPSYILRTGSGRTDGCDVYGVISWIPIIVVFGEGTQLPTCPVVTRRPNAEAGGGCCFDSSKFVCAR